MKLTTHGRQVIVALIISFFWFMVIFINHFREKNYSCSIDDGMCNSANTLSGDIFWSLFFFGLTIYPTLLFVYVVYRIFRKFEKNN